MLPEQIAQSIAEVGAEETASIMARALCFIAHTINHDLEFNFDNIEHKKIKMND
ncbi:MAG: hypothetical protein ACSHWT_12650 [Glaciecola sp.]